MLNLVLYYTIKPVYLWFPRVVHKIDSNNTHILSIRWLVTVFKKEIQNLDNPFEAGNAFCRSKYTYYLDYNTTKEEYLQNYRLDLGYAKKDIQTLEEIR